MPMSLSPWSFVLAFLGGLLTAFSPCVLPILPILVGRSLSTHRFGPVALVAGLIGGFSVAGSLLGVASSWVSGWTNFLRIFAIVILLILGFLSIFPTWSYLLISKLPKFKVRQPERIGLLGEFGLGTQLGLLWTPCAGPVLGSIIILAAAKHDIFGSFVLLFIYGLGAGVPMLMIAYGSRYLSNSFVRLRKYTPLLQKIGGVAIALTAIAILLGWDQKIQLFLAPFFPQVPL
jgi:cytochrome c-type biogenesis protein